MKSSEVIRVDPIIITGRCRICKSSSAQEITWEIHRGRPYAEIIAAFPDDKLTKDLLSKHKRHFVAPEIVESEENDLSDHEAIDLLRRVGVGLLKRMEQGHDLSMTQTRIIGDMVRGILGRGNIQDSQKQMKAFMQLLEEASKRVWTE